MSTRKPTLMTTTMKDRAAERNGARRTVYGVRANNKYHEEVRMNGGRGSTEFPFKGGDTYVGEWANNVEEGFGTKTWVKGHKYEGEWMAGMRHGKGTFWVKEGGRLRKQYAGDWQNDQRHGQGIFMMVGPQSRALAPLSPPPASTTTYRPSACPNSSPTAGERG
mmetsp:Transcript_63725/g.176042  ORF Transcript_63725/g.176042 Transcript_63725/m.176042 type:complete len:164 (+) Transcript_63725:250-741(+)